MLTAAFLAPKKFFSPKIPLCHIPIQGCWRMHAVLKPLDSTIKWRPLWKASDTIEVSQLKIKGVVRLLIGPEDCAYYLVSVRSDKQIKLVVVGYGHIWNHGPYCRLPLL